jgi:hypothetical protein
MREKTGSELIFSVSTNAIHRVSQCFGGFLKKDRSFWKKTDSFKE